MVQFWKAAAAVLITIILVLSLEKQGKDIGILLTVAVCCMVGISFFTLLEPVISFLYELQNLTYMDVGTVKLLFKLVGIGLTAEISSVICADAGCASLGKSLQLLASALILYMSIPVFQSLIDVIRDIMGGL